MVKSRKEKKKVTNFDGEEEVKFEKEKMKVSLVPKIKSHMMIAREKELKKEKFGGIKQKMRGRGFAARVPDRSSRAQVCEFLNGEVNRYMDAIIEKRDPQKPITSEEGLMLSTRKKITDETPLFAESNISHYLGAAVELQEIV